MAKSRVVLPRVDRVPVSSLNLQDATVVPPDLAGALYPGPDGIPPPPEVSAFAQSAPPDELRSAQQESDLLRFLSSQGQGFDEAGRIIAGIPGRMQVDLAGADRPVQQVQQRQAEAYKVAQAAEAKRREAAAKAEREAKEAQRRKERGEDIARGLTEGEKNRRAQITAGRGREEAAKAEADTRADEVKFSQENILSNRLRSSPAAKQYDEALPQLDVVMSGAANPGAISDTALQYAFLKFLDPGATVTQSDSENIMMAGGVPERIRSAVSQSFGEGTFSPEIRKEMAQFAERQLVAKRKRYEEEADRVATDAIAYGLDPARVVGAWWKPKPSQPAASRQQAGPPQGKVWVQKGNDRQEIDIADLKEAEADGYKKVGAP